MAFLKRLSDGFWSYVSPVKPDATNENNTIAPQTVPKVQKPVRPLRKGAVGNAIGHSRSMSPVERVDSWRLTPSTSSATASKKRKRAGTGRGPGRPRKRVTKMEDDEMDYTPQVEDDDSDVIMQDGEDDDELDQHQEDEEDEEVERDGTDGVSPSPSSLNKRYSRSPSSKGYVDEFTESEIDTSLVVGEEEYSHDSPKRKMLISPTTEHFSRGVSTDVLRAQGWDDDHISLVQHIAMRGFEPLMPHFWHFEYRFHFPDSLFAADDTNDTIINSVRGDHFRGLKALEKILELGARVRDRVMLKGRVRPEQQVRRTMKDYMKWAEEDSGLDRNRAIPILVLEAKSRDYDPEQMKQNAKRKLAASAARYREAFKVLQSIENSPVSRTSTQLSYPVPTLYAIVASHTLIALSAYNPDEAEPDVKIVAVFDMKDKDYDVWNALALAIVVCHVRNVQMRIAEETGLGLKSAMDEDEEESDDPDA